MIWRHLLRLTLVGLLVPGAALAKIYSCDGPNGGTMLTDQPKGKLGCKPVSTLSPSPPGGYTPPVDTAPSTLEAESLPTLPPNAFVPSLPLPKTAPGQRPPGPLDQSQPPTGSQAAGEKAAPESQHCAPRVNPLNPFAGINCPPASGTTSEESKTP